MNILTFFLRKLQKNILYRNICPEKFSQKDALKNFEKFNRIQKFISVPCQSLFSNNVAGPGVVIYRATWYTFQPKLSSSSPRNKMLLINFSENTFG